MPMDKLITNISELGAAFVGAVKRGFWCRARAAFKLETSLVISLQYLDNPQILRNFY